MKIVLKLLLALLVISPAYGLFNSEPASADPFECTSTFYQVILGTLVELDPITGDYTTLGGTASFNTNAIGYNVEDDFIYGIRPNAGTPELVRIELQAGSVLVTPLGVPTGLPAGSYVSGDFDDLGNLHVNSATNMYVIDVSAGTAVELPLSQNLPVNDIVFVDGFFYGTNGTNLYQVDPSNGNVVVTPLGLPAVNVYGAGWAADNSKLFFAHNPTGNIYEISDFDTVAPTYAQVLQGEDTIGNDGASCPTARSPIPAFTIADDSAETTVNTPITVNAENGLLANDSGRQIEVTSYTQPSSGSVNVNPDGSFTYTPNNGFVGEDTFEYTITDEYGETLTALVTITVVEPATVPTTQPTTTVPPSVEGDGVGQLPVTGTALLGELILSALLIGLGSMLVAQKKKRNLLK